ncbi:MAG: polysaccharide deacetylase family protein [Labilithrix sp.]|nr:polysaccharide deacetylase family protein [Labilithrix sp.]
MLSTLAFTDAGCKKSESQAESNCRGAQALSKVPLTGSSMKLKQISLTFDDGPGLRTVELSAYLKSEGIRAAFFIWGGALKNEGGAAGILQHLVDDGHLVANHTETHRSLTENKPTALTDQEIVAELTEVDTAITPFVKDNKWLFRPPYGQFDDRVLTVLEGTPMKKYVGPILWNVGGMMSETTASDAECWKPETLHTVTDCGDLYLKEIDSVGKGIVLLHDPYFIQQNNPESGGTYQMVQYMVPILKSKGYSFVRVDEVPDIAALLPGGAPAGAADGGEATPDGTNPEGDGTAVDPCL